MTIKVKYNPETTLIESNYPSSINYPNIVIDEEAKTIDGSPYIEITNEEHQDNLDKTMCVKDGAYQEYIKPDSILLQEAKDSKKALIKSHRDAQFGKLLFYKTIDGTDLYLKPKPQENIFMASFTMADGTTKDWYPYDVDCNKQPVSVAITKEELMAMAAHYEVRKTNTYNLCNQMCFDIDALTTVEEVEVYDINNIIS
ncbi:MAG: hypothetical protein ACXACY_27820 [Candidatus Hodarchaeales archaeon]|jgi:hypothetical protein